ncbi:MAG: KEOPS complex kinase/ATPase Bud32 [Candidatus Aenigmatarchaeota archaeon]
MPMKIIQQGAEAILYLDKFEGKEVLVKERIEKGYRVPDLDKTMRRQRTKNENRLLERARRAGVHVPRVLELEEFKIIMEYIKGDKLKNTLDSYDKTKRMQVYKLIGESIASLHSSSVIHGDLTTSNMILKNSKPGAYELYLIDFGLGRFSQKIEDQAVDLHLLYEALKAAHFKRLEETWNTLLNVYKDKYTRSKEVSKQIEKIKKRRRYLGD